MSREHGMEHPWRSELPGYALGALDPGERVQVERHLTDCESCRRELAAYEEVAGLVGRAVPAAEPSAALRARILADARAVRPLPAPAEPGPSAASSRHRQRPLTWLALAASLLAAVALGVQSRRERGARLALEQRQAALLAQLASRDSLLAALLAPDVTTVRLTAEGREPAIRLYWNRRRQVLVLTAADLPPAPDGRVYQLWGIVPGRPPRSLGTFNTSPEGRGTVTLPLASDLQMAVSAVTEEPAGGSPQPTSTPFLVGEWAGS